MPGVGKHETIDELGMPVRQPLRVAATGGDAHDPDRAPPLLANDRGVVVGDVDRRAAGREVGPSTDVDEREVVPLDRL